MRAILVLAALAAACKPKLPAAAAPAAAAPAPELNRAEKYVGALQNDVKRAQDAKEKADAAVKKEQEAEKVPE